MLPISSVERGDELQADAAMVDGCACDDLEHGNPANTAQHPNTYNSRLEALPDELLMAIFEQFICDNSRPRVPDERIPRRNFRNLCLVSKRIDLITRPYLFQTVFIRHTGTLLKLCRTIAGDRHLAEQIKAISFSIGDLDEIAKLDPAERKKLRDACYQYIGECKPQMSQGVQIEYDLIGILWYKLLAWAVNLSSLVVGIDTTKWSESERRASADYWYLASSGMLRHQNFLEFFGCVRDATRSVVEGGAAVFLPRLETVAIEAIGHHHAAVSAVAFEPFLGLPSLRTVRSTGDDGNWSRLLPGPWPELYAPLPHLHDQQMANRNITTLDVSDSLTCQFDIEDIVRLFPCLEVIVLETDCYTSQRLEHSIVRSSRIELSSALERLTALRTLQIVLYPTFAVSRDIYEDITASLGPGKVLNLARLQNLQRVEVPLYMLARPGELYDGVIAVPREVLPQSLKTLVLLAQHGCKRGCLSSDKLCLDQMESAVEFLESLLDDLAYFPHLESVAHCHLLGSFTGAYMLTARGTEDEEAAENSTGPRLKAIHASFLKQNVQFYFQESGDPFHGYRKTIDLDSVQY